MNFDEHDGHDAPRVYVSEREPRYVGICPGHDGPGPWGPPVPYVPRNPNIIEEMEQLVCGAELNPPIEVAQPAREDIAAEIDEVFRRPVPPSNGADWQLWAVAEVAVDALRGIGRERRRLHYHVSFWALDEDARRELTLARRFAPHDERLVSSDDRHVVVSTADIDDVAFLVSFPVRRVLSPFVTVLAQSERFVTAFYFDWDEDRFYIAEAGAVAVRHVLWAVAARGVEIVNDTVDIPMMTGTPDHLAALREWMKSGEEALPEALL